MGNIQQVNIKNRTYYLFNHLINIKNFDSNLPERDKKSYKKHWYLLYQIHHNGKY